VAYFWVLAAINALVLLAMLAFLLVHSYIMRGLLQEMARLVRVWQSHVEARARKTEQAIDDFYEEEDSERDGAERQGRERTEAD
jgi:hypothetical protein